MQIPFSAMFQNDLNKWMVYDKETDQIKTATARNQKHAIQKIFSLYGITPKRTDHARPRTGQGELMTPQQFNDFMRN